MAETTADGQELIKCSRCRCKNTIDHFKINRHGNPLKTCMACNARDRAGRACKHGREKNKCIECGGVGVCCHRRVRSACKECKGGAICEHGNRRTYCAPCGGTSLCAHGIEAKDCSICDPVGYLAKLTRGRVKSKLKATNPKLDIIEHVGCDVGQLRVHLEALFDDDMTWENYDLIPRLHWTNLQPLWAKDNIAKGNRYQAMSMVECTYDSRPEGYDLLGSYTGGGENALGLPMPKTCPCVMMPCLEPEKKMFYVLPSPHTPFLEGEPLVPPPEPSDLLQRAGVKVYVEAELKVAVIKFSGYATPDVVFKCRDDLKRMLARDQLEQLCFQNDVDGSSSNEDSSSSSESGSDDVLQQQPLMSLEMASEKLLMIAQYNELFSLPWNRDNEVWIPLGCWPVPSPLSGSSSPETP